MKTVPNNGALVRFEVGRNIDKPRTLEGYVTRVNTDDDGTVRVYVIGGGYYTVAVNDLDVI